ncbi:MAG: flavoprotein [Mycobacteriaceae bacterium]|nr:flavoprotein [Mycobacteriaceae bacterium]
MNDRDQPVLYAIVTGSPAAREVGRLVDIAQADGWDVCVVASPDGRKFIDAAALESRTGHPVRSQYKDPEAPDVLPPADAMIAAPLTCNSAAKWAAGICDTLPLGMLVEAVGKGMPVVAVPISTSAQLGFPAVRNALDALSSWGVTVLADVAPADVATAQPWLRAWQAVRARA